ncbi:hypothetical protein [Romboutsia maritimum]|uniref:hypothetical protein n=1 Tax=Romboutsia maritimum TaxID=2020948 RepID=UPI001314366F|nr:hypothetical protein [Romboutsia maritimum]
MSDIKNNFENIKGDQINHNKIVMKADARFYQREPHGIQEGIRKDKKIKMNRKLYN